MTPTQILGASLFCTIIGLFITIFGGGAKVLLYLGKISGVIDGLKELPDMIDDLRYTFDHLDRRVSRLEDHSGIETKIPYLPNRRRKGGQDS